MFYFDKKEIETIVSPELQQRVSEIKQRFDLRNNFYNQLRTNTFDLDAFGKINNLIPEHTKRYKEWNAKWQNISTAAQQNSIEPIITFFNEANEIFSDFERNLPETGLLNIDEGTMASNFKRETLSKVSQEIDKLKLSIDLKVDESINHLLKIKSESLLEKDFSTNIVSTLKNSKDMSFRFFVAFIASIIISLLAFISTFFIKEISDLTPLSQITLRVSIIAFLWIGISFIYSHYRLYKTLEIKYNHLATLQGGGATHINSLIKDGGENVKNATYEKLVNQFMDITDLTNMFGKVEHPTIKSLDKALELVKDLSKK